MIGMHLGIAPVRDLVGLTVPRHQGLALLVLKDHQWFPVGGAVNAEPRDIAAPALRFYSEMWQAIETAALEEALPDVLDAPLHLGLVLGMPDSGRVGDKAAALGVFQESPGEDGMQCVRSRHRRREIVDDQIARDAAEECPGRLQASDDVLQLLAEGGPDEAVPRVSQHHDQRPHRAAVSRVRIVDQTQPAEVHLRHLARRGVPPSALWSCCACSSSVSG